MIVSFGTNDDMRFWQYWLWSIPSVRLTFSSQIFHSWTWVQRLVRFLKYELYQCWCSHLPSRHRRLEKVGLFTHFLHGLSKYFIQVTEIDSNYKCLHSTYRLPRISYLFNWNSLINTNTSYETICYALVDINISLYRFAYSDDSHIRTNHLITSVFGYARFDCTDKPY